ncbi:hypothetical protein [Enterococcus sp. AZ192]|uniref:hypothetical protein n=1 Tax=unclassified Enterococcus TaxID=2608891 RepID=UPI003D280A32
MNIDKNWDKLLSRTKTNTEQKFKQKKEVKNIDSIVKELVLDADVDDDNIWNYIYYLKSGNDYISFNEYILAHALKCSIH